MRLQDLSTTLPPLSGIFSRSAGGASIESRLLQNVLSRIGGPPLAFELWTGERVSTHRSPAATVVVPDRRALAQLALNPDVAFCDGYADGTLQVRGDLVEMMESIHRHNVHRVQGPPGLDPLALWYQLTQSNTMEGSRRNIHHHYDLGNAFYERWLDETMSYTCAYFADPAMSLEQAQVAKMDHVCRKLRLRPGERVVEAGCGWGSLALHMAEYYGVRVRAYNISREQVTWAREQARQRGLSGQVEYILDDYRNIEQGYDAFVSVGMLEHVGVDHYDELGRVIHRAVGREGRGLLHFIGRSYPAPLNPWIKKRIFPGAHLPTLREMSGMLEPHPFAVVDVENLRAHYARTLECWLDRFESHAEEVAGRFDEAFVRAWRLYLAGSIGGFRAGTLQLFQVLFFGPDSPLTPMTREHLYAAPNAAASTEET